MSRIRYCLPVWGTEFIRFSESDPISSIIHDLQVVQNDMLCIITGCKRREHVRISDMLEKTKMLSINQLIAYSMILEVWKSRIFKVPHLATLHDNDRDDNRTLRSDTANNIRSSVVEPFAVCSEKLWNMSSHRFKATNLIKVAKIEARKMVQRLPV